MIIGRAKFSDGNIALVRLGEHGNVWQIEGVGPDDIIEVAMSRGKGLVDNNRRLALTDIKLLSPIELPRSIRDFSTFESHTKNCVEGIGGKMNPLWYEIPAFYFSNPNCVIGTDDTVVPPKAAKSLDYELEVAALIGRQVVDLQADSDDWTSCIAGFMLMNDWSARDLGAKETKLFMGPAKAKDFATSLGPWLVTPDEFEISEGRIALPLTARVNGETWSNGNLREMYFTWPRILAHASADASLYPGDVIGSGTCGSGCIIELRYTGGREKYTWLKAGDVVELEAPKLGLLRNRISEQA